ncbi:MAG: hybrid sensor histidine kinase/response regulator [Deltaproteobacteria bacterium]|nr:hybrid sensor histidine kinase/response regulator [Deltaproteobacteria bacterium]
MGERFLEQHDSTSWASGAQSRRPFVLYVDDQVDTLRVFEATFGGHADVVTAGSAVQGLELLGQHEFTVVVSDQRMDPMSGTEFLAEVRRRNPDLPRILLTAYMSFDDAVSAINDGQVHRFIMKPWQAQDVIATLVNATELYERCKENRALSEQLLHRERLAAIGQLTSGLVHELTNIATVFTVIDELRGDWQAGRELGPHFELLERGFDAFQLLTDALRLFAKGGDPLQLERERVDLNETVVSAATLLRLFPAGRALRAVALELPPTPVKMSLDVKKIQQVLVNLLKNAAEACPKGSGRVSLSVEANESRAVVRVADNGPGISPEVVRRLWDGFVTTKGRQGTGLGLWMCRKAVLAHGGTIEHTPGPDGGAVFTITLPRK